MSDTDILKRVANAATAAELCSNGDAVLSRSVYRRLVLQVHPDHHGDDNRDLAEKATSNLNRIWKELNGNGSSAFTVHTKKRRYDATGLYRRGDICNLYEATADLEPVLLKMPRNPRDNDLVTREATALKKLRDVADEHAAYFPVLRETFRHKEPARGIVRQGLVLDCLDGFHTLTEVREAFPDGMDPRDVAWIFRRLLVALGAAHRLGVVHGAIVPDHLLLELDQHGLVIVDWSYSVIDETGRVPAFAGGSRWKHLYPREVCASETPAPGTDVYMAAKVLEWALGDQAPRQMRAFINGCVFERQKVRPQDAWSLLKEFDELIERLYGPRRFKPFTWPNGYPTG